MLTLSLSGLRRGPHSALLDTGRLTRSVAGGRCFLLADLLLLVRRTIDFAAQSNLAFLGMWRCSNRPDLAELLPFDADAGSSSNMVSSQPGVPLGLQSSNAVFSFPPSSPLSIFSKSSALFQRYVHQQGRRLPPWEV